MDGCEIPTHPSGAGKPRAALTIVALDRSVWDGVAKELAGKAES